MVGVDILRHARGGGGFRRGGIARGGEFVVFFAFGAVADDLGDCFFDPYPVEFLGDVGGGFVNSAVGFGVHSFSDFVLTLAVGNDFFVF